MGDPNNAELEGVFASLSDVQGKLEDLDAKIALEHQQIEDSHIGHRAPFYKERDALIAKIPNFWISAMSNHPVVGSWITNEEEEALNHLAAFHVKYGSTTKKFTLVFTFSENPFFTNKVIEKAIDLTLDDEIPVGFVSEVQWKAGKNLVEAGEKNAEGNEEAEEGFFANLYSADEPIAELFDDLYKNAVAFFTDADEDESEEDGDDDDEEELEEDDDEQPVKKNKH